MAETKAQKKRFEPGEIIISEVTKEDLQSLSEGYYQSFPVPWFDRIEPHEMRPSDPWLQAHRFGSRMQPWLLEPHTYWTKATLSPSSPSYDPSNPNRVIGHAGWLRPERTKNEIMNFWRRDASDALGWREKMGWSQEDEDELWKGTDLPAYQESFIKWDAMRGEYLKGVGHWHLAPLWVLPEHQGRGVASMLLRDGIEKCDKETPGAPMYLEAMPAARVIYHHLGWMGVEGEGKQSVMIRNPPEHVKTLEGPDVRTEE